MLKAETRALIQKYNCAGPRYTSYPTALQFREAEGQGSGLEQTRKEAGPLSLYFHLPFCESLCWFCACTTVITRNPELADRYIENLFREMDWIASHIRGGRKVEQLHFGGGSPSFLTAPQLDRLCTGIRERFTLSSSLEFSVELDPRTLREDKVHVLAQHGCNRVSFGVQDVREPVQKAVHRIQPDALNRQCLEWVRQEGISAVNVDLIYGLPEQTEISFRETLHTVLEYDPDRLAVFSYAHVPWVAPAQKILERSKLPEPEEKFAMLLATIEVLTGNGYTYIGMDHFAKDDDSLTQALQQGQLHRNFQGYTTLAGAELIGMGMSSISMNSRIYRQNHKELPEWTQRIENGQSPMAKVYQCTPEDTLRREIIMGIMCSGQITFSDFERRFSIHFRDHFRGPLEKLAELQKDGLVELSEDTLTVTPSGRLLLRNIAMPFDAYLQSKANRHAKTV